MKYAAHGLLAAFLALRVYGAIPDSAEGWYTPSGGFSRQSGSGTVYWWEDGGEQSVSVSVDEDGNVTGGIAIPEGSPELRTAYEALVKACANEALNAMQDESIKTIGKNLYDLTRKTGIEVTNENTGQKFTIKFDGSIAEASAGSSGGNIPATSDADDPADNKTLNWTDNSANAKLQIYGARTATSTKERIWDDRGYVIPCLDGTGTLGWKRFGGINELVFDKRADGGGNMELTLKNFHVAQATDPLSKLLTDESASNRDRYYLVSRYGTGDAATLHYLPIGAVISGNGAPLDDVTMTTNTASGAIADGKASLYGWNTSPGVESLADKLTANLEADSGDTPTYEVLARCTDGENASLEYLTLGNLHGVTWATNWTESVEHITKEETIQIVSFVTNSWTHENFVTNIWNHENFITNTWNHESFVTNVFNNENFVTNIFTHENFITNVIDKYSTISNFENFVTFQTNMFYHETFLTNAITHENFITNVIDKYSTISNFENFVTFQTNMFNNVNVITNLINNVQSIENWTYVTNYIVRYLGGTYDPGGDGGDGDGGPTIAPEDDPYSEEYVPQEIDDYLLPVKNARNIVAITNDPFAMLDSRMMLDFQSIDTNKSWLAQLYGFEEAQTGTTPVKQSDGDGGYKLEWVEHPADLLAITTNGIAEIKQWMVKNNVTNIFTSVVSNAEAVATMSTNIFAHVKAETMLDNESVWTNGTRRVEIKGYKTASLHTVPYIDYRQADYEAGRNRTLYWERLPFADTEAMSKYGDASVPSTIDAVLYGSTDDQGADVKGLTLHGFAEAEAGQVPVKRALNGMRSGIEWEYPMSGDEKSLTTNYNHGAVNDGTFSIYGYRTATAGQLLARTANGVTWTNVQTKAKVDGVSIVTNAAEEISLKGFTAAEVGTVPQKTANGLEWLKASSATNILLAGAGINITDNGGGVITISARELSTTNTPYGNLTYLTVLTDARYDAVSHKMQVKRRTLTFYGVAGEETEWEDVFEAISHKSEHIATE